MPARACTITRVAPDAERPEHLPHRGVEADRRLHQHPVSRPSADRRAAARRSGSTMPACATATTLGPSGGTRRVEHVGPRPPDRRSVTVAGTRLAARPRGSAPGCRAPRRRLRVIDHVLQPIRRVVRVKWQERRTRLRRPPPTPRSAPPIGAVKPRRSRAGRRAEAGGQPVRPGVAARRSSAGLRTRTATASGDPRPDGTPTAPRSIRLDARGRCRCGPRAVSLRSAVVDEGRPRRSVVAGSRATWR